MEPTADKEKRIYELAKDYKISSPAMMKIISDLGFQPKSHMSVASDDMIKAVEGKFNKERQTAKREMEQKSMAKEAREKAALASVAPPPPPTPVAQSTPAPVTRPPQQPTPGIRQQAALPPARANQPGTRVNQSQYRGQQQSSGSQTPRQQYNPPAASSQGQQPQQSQPTQQGQQTQQSQQSRPQQRSYQGQQSYQQRPAPAPYNPPTTPGVPGKIKVVTQAPALVTSTKEIEKRKKKKDRRKKKDRQVDQAEVARSFKATMADLGGRAGRRRTRRADEADAAASTEAENVIQVNEYMSVAELAKLMEQRPADVIAKLFELGLMATINQRLDMDTIEMIADEFGYGVKVIAEIGEAAREEEHSETMSKRAPIVTVMGHVDHGKTSLLDYIRKTNVVAGEAGAITQHIGAYEVVHNGDRIVFLDTPGHEAFTAMRARGAHLTDIVVLVVAADEGVMPQTIEAIDHARAANVPIIVAITKVDKPGANPENVRMLLSKQNLLSEAWGGKIIMVEVSSKKGIGIDKLLEMILLQAEMLDLKADPAIRAQGIVVDSRLEKGRGSVVTVLVQKGTCKIGDPIVAGSFNGRIRTITNDRDQRINEVGPATPAQITGLDGVPQAGDSFMAVRDDQEAKEISLKRSQLKREYEFRRPQGHVTLEKVFDQIKEGQIKEVRLVIKGDVDGSVEVLADTLTKISTSEVKTTVIRQGVGAITESDVLLAAASNAIIIGFQVAPDSRARELARREKVDIRTYDIIYEAENDVRKALEGLLSPELSEKFVGQAEIRDTFRVPKVGVVAGSYVKEGRINRKDKIRLIRDGKVVYTGQLASLRRFKDDAREVKEGFECGIGIENFNDIKVGDIIEAFEVVETARTLS
ncbi:MAG: translation initiation factor IF-2 [Candidatus Zixiibacteriota bacterium]